MNSEPCDNSLRQQVLQTTLQQISSQGVSDRATEPCVICLGNLVEPCEAHPCRHNNFDYLCLVTWLEKRATCPLCKSDVSEVRYELGEDGKQAKVHKVPEHSERGNISTQHSGRQSSGDNLEQHSRWLFDDEVTWRRRFIYRHNLYSLHVGSNRRQSARLRYRELLPEHFITDPELVSRARMWLSRELRVFEFLHTDSGLSRGHGTNRWPRPSTAEYLLEYIIAILKSMDTQGSTGQAENMIQEFLGRDNTRLLLHELGAWLRSPFESLTEWDRAVQYPERNVLSLISQDTASASGS
ncbi:RING U-box [Fusarium albosuccineum]|uniref:RING-type E3 ubiquitin transferase n=1 Tax=Fusarium albosuccineum TaxID=1237068 RepID=A0A8H4L286_9HYPO|nr:RING U-box [Fusarium albosuccineum]